jgi:hypothetical protein
LSDDAGARLIPRVHLQMSTANLALVHDHDFSDLLQVSFNPSSLLKLIKFPQNSSHTTHSIEDYNIWIRELAPPVYLDKDGMLTSC